MLAHGKINAFNPQEKSVSLQINWRNSWRNEVNFDGVYIFLKYKPKSREGYETMKIVSVSPAPFQGKDAMPDGFDKLGENIKTGIYVPDTKIGFFVFPEEACYKQKIEIKEIKVPVEVDEVEAIEVFAIEMVYIPEGSFKIGDIRGSVKMGGKAINGFYTYPNKPTYQILSNDKIEFGPEEGMLYCDMDNPFSRSGAERFTIPEHYPKGYQAMWYMKHPLTMSQWVKFLNCLTRKQQQAQVHADLSGDEVTNYYVMTNTDHVEDRNEIFCKQYGNGISESVKFYTSMPHTICNVLDWFSLCSFACFAGLRPITELEYIKACRGPLEPVANEFAWGSAHIGRVWNFDVDEAERIDRPIPERPGCLANANYDAHTEMLQGKPKPFKGTAPDWGGSVSESTFENAPLVKGYSERECMGASYYGVLELSGNLWEYLISIGNEKGRAFDGSHGSGYLTSEGLYDMPSWPNPMTGEGFSQRGGNYVSDVPPKFFIDSRPFGTFSKKSGIAYHGGIRVGF